MRSIILTNVSLEKAPEQQLNNKWDFRQLLPVLRTIAVFPVVINVRQEPITLKVLLKIERCGTELTQRVLIWEIEAPGNELLCPINQQNSPEHREWLQKISLQLKGV